MHGASAPRTKHYRILRTASGNNNVQDAAPPAIPASDCQSASPSPSRALTALAASQPHCPYRCVPVRGETLRAHHSSQSRPKLCMRGPDDGFTQGASLSQAWPNGSNGLPSVPGISPPGALHKSPEGPTPCSLCIGRVSSHEVLFG
jgi:hypothetical protein